MLFCVSVGWYLYAFFRQVGVWKLARITDSGAIEPFGDPLVVYVTGSNRRLLGVQDKKATELWREKKPLPVDVTSALKKFEKVMCEVGLGGDDLWFWIGCAYMHGFKQQEKKVLWGAGHSPCVIVLIKCTAMRPCF